MAEACRQLDLLDQLRKASKPLVVNGKVNPAVVEQRLVRVELRRALAQPCLPDQIDDEEPTVSPEVANLRSVRGRRAARARWDRRDAT